MAPPPSAAARAARRRRHATRGCGALLFSAAAVVAWGVLVPPPPPHPLHLIVAFESLPRGHDGAERYLAAGVRALAALPHTRVTLAFRSEAGACLIPAASRADLGPSVAAVLAPPGSRAFRSLLFAHARTAVLLPLAFFPNCGGAPNASSEAYAADLWAHNGGSGGASRRVPFGVWAMDAQAVRARSLSSVEPDAGQSARYAADSDAMGAREAVLYGRADVLAMLTPEDLSAAERLSPPLPPSTVRLITHFRDDAVEGLRARDHAPPAEERARAVAGASPQWKDREGFVFMGGGDNPTNAVALRAFLLDAWPAIRAALPRARLDIIGSPPRAQCAAHGIWCDGWTSHTPYAAPDDAKAHGIVSHGLVPDVGELLSAARVALAPIVAGTGVNTKSGFFLGRGLPLVGTPKAARGYALEGGGWVARAHAALFGAPPPGGMVIAPTVRDMARAAVELHEDAAAWAAASLAALTHSARLDDERSAARDFAALRDALDDAVSGGGRLRSGGAIAATAAAAAAEVELRATHPQWV